MSGGFNNPIIGGGGGLVYPSIHSPNYLTGISGWTINKDGSAEFQNAIIRGTVQAGTFIGSDFIINASGTFIYDGAPAAGNLIATDTSADGTDAFGNTYLGGRINYINNGLSYDAVGFQGGTVSFWNSPTFNGVYTLEASIFYASGTALEIVTQLANGNIIIGPAATGTVIFPAGTDPIVANKSGAAESWQSMNTRGYQNGWTDAGVGNVGGYRLIPSPANEVELRGELTGGTLADNTVIINLPNAYHPSVLQVLPLLIPGAGAVANMRLNINTNGNVTCLGIAGLGAGPRVILPNLTYSLD